MLHDLLGSSPGLVAVREELARLLARPGTSGRRVPPILIQGETGTGKGLVARMIHQMGSRRDAAFVDVNCAAIPETLLEAELFGFERGAFTDARQAKAGLLQIAHRGTIFLDEIGLMPEALQAKLLKAIEDRVVRRLGSTRSEPADAWVLAATSEDLAAAIAARRFREDLYHRLAVITVQLPPLRERGEDVLLLARHFLEQACAEYQLSPKTLTADGEAALMSYPWPGNVRELANVMERVALLSDSEQVSASSLRLPRAVRPPAPAPRSGAGGVDEQVAALERKRIEEALRAEGGNISRAAARLGLARNTLRYRMERHRLHESAETATTGRRSSPAERTTDERVRTPDHAPAVRWQRARVTFVHAQLFRREAAPDAYECAHAIEQLAAKVTAFGGRVLDVSDSGVKAAFGIDLQEDAARHAANAALAMHRVFQTSFEELAELRIALHTEEQRVGRLDERVEIDADDRRNAERVLEPLLNISAGQPIVASGSSRPFLERWFTLEPMTDRAGSPPAWRVVGRSDVEGHAAPFVARSRELAILDDLLAQAEEGRGQAVLLIGDPGIGKTRLLAEFRRRTRSRAAWFQGSAVSFGSALPFHPLIDLIKDAFSIQPDDSDDVVRERIASVTAAFDAEFQPSVPFLRSLLSLDADEAPLDPKLRRAGIFEAIGRWFHAIASVRPTIVVLEDLHWMDPATGEFLTMMAESLKSGRLLLCATQRAGYAQPAAATLFGTQLTLSPVSRADTGTIASSLLDAASLSPQLQQLVEDRSEGNPFFIEEIVRSLNERGLVRREGDQIKLQGAAGHEVPDSIHDVLLGRIERLDPALRRIVGVAAVIGREFPRRVLERAIPEAEQALDERLQRLRSTELIQKARVWPEVVYAFKHALTQEVAYQTLSETERSREHAAIAEAMEQVYADRITEQCGVLAHHFTRARRWRKALDYLLKAAQQAERSFATREALALYDQALHVAEQSGGDGGDPATMMAIYEAKARLYFVTSEFALSAAEGERILPLARLTGNRVKEAEALAIVAWASTWQRQLDTAIRYAQEALAVAEPIGAIAVQGRAHYIIGFIRGITGVLEESHVSLDKAMALSVAAGDPFHRSLSLSMAGLLRNWTGDYAEADRLQAEGHRIAQERSLLSPLLFSCFMRGLTLTGKGDYDGALASFDEGLSFAERIGDEAIHHRLLNCLGWLYADLGDLDYAETVNAASAQIGRRRSDPGTQPNAELNLAEIFHTRGEFERAKAQYDEVFRYWKNPSGSLWMRFRYSIRMFAGLGEVALSLGDLGAARTYKAECLALATERGSRKHLVKGWRLAAEIAHAERNNDDAEAHFRTALDLARALGNPVQIWTTELAYGRFLMDVARPDAAQGAFDRAIAERGRVLSTLRDERLRAALTKNPLFQLFTDFQK